MATVLAALRGRSGMQPYLLFAVAIIVPLIFSNGGFVNFLADAGAFVLLALGLNIVIGFAGLLDLGMRRSSRSVRTRLPCSRARSSAFTFRFG